MYSTGRVHIALIFDKRTGAKIFAKTEGRKFSTSCSLHYFFAKMNGGLPKIIKSTSYKSAGEEDLPRCSPPV